MLEAPPTDPEVSGLCYDSRRLKAGDCFVAIPGTHTDGHRYVETALRDGAVAAVVQRRVGTAWPQVVVPDSRRALGLMASTLFGHPSRGLGVIGVTGTDGKTTTTTMIQQMLLSAGRTAGSMSTVDIRVGDDVDVNETRQTTLEALEIQEHLVRMRDRGLKYAVIESSSRSVIERWGVSGKTASRRSSTPCRRPSAIAMPTRAETTVFVIENTGTRSTARTPS